MVFFVVCRLVLAVAAVEEVDKGIKGGGVLVHPAVVVEGIGVGLAGGEDFPVTNALKISMP